jgi:hypothetical protein
MYPTTGAYKTAITQNIRNVRITGSITLKDSTIINISDEDIVQGSLYVSEQAVSGEDIEIGNVYASELGVSLDVPLANPYSLDGARVELNFGLDIGSSLWENVPLGVFYITDIQRKQNVVNIKAIDSMLLFDIPCGEPGSSSPRNLVVHACNLAGVTLGTSIAEIDTFANATLLFAAPDASKIKTCRDLLMWACQIMGAFARIGKLGQLEIIPIKSKVSSRTISKQERFSSKVSDFAIQITKVTMQIGDTSYARGIEGMILSLEENPLMAGMSEGQINSVLDNILAQITTAIYVPFDAEFIGDPSIQPGDYITLSDTSALGSSDIASIITHSTWRYRGPHNLKGAGKHGLIRGVQNQQVKAVSSIVAIARAAQDLALSADQTAQLLNEAIGGNVLIRQSPDETNEILIMDHPDPDQATKIWRWNMGGLGYSDNVTGADNPAREYDIAMTMDGAINANFIKTGQLDAGMVQIGSATNFEEGFLSILMQVQGITPGMDADENCTAMYHFDGGLAPSIGPNLTFTRPSPAYLEDGTKVEANKPRFEDGKFGKAYLGEVGATNLLINPNFDTDSDWGTDATWHSTGGRDGGGYYSYGYGWGFVQDVTINKGTTYTASVYVRGNGTGRINVYNMSDSSSPGDKSVVIPNDGKWHRISASFSVAGTGTVTVLVRLLAAVGTLDFDQAQLEIGEYLNPFSIGTRANEVLTIPTTGILTPAQGTLSVWAYFDSSKQGPYSYLWDTDGSRFIAYKGTGGTILILFDGVSAFGINYPSSGWHMVTVEWAGALVALFIDGDEVATTTLANPVAFTGVTKLYLGSNYAGSQQWNNPIDELRIDKVARTDAEISGWYTTEAPFWVKADLDALPGYLKLEPDGIKVYDSSDALRVLLGSWLSGAIRKYGLKIIGGEIYSSQIFTGKEGDTSYAYLGPVTEFYTYPFGMKLNGKELFDIMSTSRGPIMSFHDPSLDERICSITTMDDAMGQGLRIQANSGHGSGDTFWRDLHLDGRRISATPTGQFYVDAGGSVYFRADTTVTIKSAYDIWLEGAVQVIGSLNVSGSPKNAVESTIYGDLAISAVECPEVRYIYPDIGILTNGECRIDIDPMFLACIEPNTEYSKWVFDVTPHGKALLYIDEIGEDYFVVKDYHEVADGVEFSWTLSAVRKDFAHRKFMEVIPKNVVESRIARRTPEGQQTALCSRDADTKY